MKPDYWVKFIKMKERRQYTRLDFSENVTFETSSTFAMDAEEMNYTGNGKAADVSDRGLCLVTREAVREDQILKINLPLLGVPVQAPTLAMVKWVVPDNGGYKVGLMFVL